MRGGLLLRYPRNRNRCDVLCTGQWQETDRDREQRALVWWLATIDVLCCDFIVMVPKFPYAGFSFERAEK